VWIKAQKLAVDAASKTIWHAESCQICSISHLWGVQAIT
jgi:hypothetical protein